MINEFLIPAGFKDVVTFNAYVEHEYKSKIIDYFRLNGFDLVKTPLIEFRNNKNTNIKITIKYLFILVSHLIILNVYI